MKNKRIVVLGGAGYVGSVLCEYLLKQGHEITVVDSLIKGSSGIISDELNYTLVNIDIRSRLLPITLELAQPDLVINLAGIVGDPACAREPEEATDVNFMALEHIISCCNELDVPLIQASTCSVYGSNQEACTEETLVKPLSHYALTKLQAETLLLDACNLPLIFRFGTMYGQSPNMRFDLVVNRLVEMAVKTGEFSVFDGTQYRPFLHPLDLATFINSLTLRQIRGRSGQVFNLVSENLSMLELGELIERTIPTSKMTLVPEKEDNRTYICKAFKAYSVLGFKPQIRVRDGIQEIERSLAIPLNTKTTYI